MAPHPTFQPLLHIWIAFWQVAGGAGAAATLLVAAEKVIISELDGSGDGDILTDRVEADADGMMALNSALSVLAQAAIFMADATV